MAEAIFTRCVNPPNVVPIEKGGTGGTTVSLARRNLDLMTQVTLYTNFSGKHGTITLSDSISNYSKIGVFYYTESVNGCAFYVEFDTNIASVLLCSVRTNDAGDICFLKSAKTVCDDKTISFSHGYQSNVTAQGITFLSDSGSIKIYKVIGYRY